MRIPLLFLTCFLAKLPAQALQEGYGSTLRSLPSGTSCVLPLEARRVVYFTGTKLVLDDGTTQRDLLTLGAPAFGSFTIPAGPGQVLFGENSQGRLWLVPLNGTPRQLATLAFNYDAALWTPNLALVSAKTGGFSSPNTEVWAVDLATGATDLLVELAGASGPVVVDPSGDLFYATATTTFPPPPGSAALLRFTQSKLVSALGPTKLDASAATRLAVSFDAAGDLALDRDRDLFVLDWWNGKVWEIDDVDGPAPLVSSLLDASTATLAPTALHFAPGRAGALARFEPFQPESGDALLVHESSFVSGASQVRAVTPARPELAASVGNPVPPGPLALEIRGGPASGVALLAFGIPGAPGERAITLAGLEAPIFWASAFTPGNELATIALNLDANGSARVPFVNPGGPRFSLLAQAAVANLPSLVFGSTNPLVLDLR